MFPWMTTTVAALMAKIDAEKCYDLLPILADALEDGGFTHESVIALLRTPADAPEAFTIRGPWYRRVVEGDATPAQVKEAASRLTEIAAARVETGYDDEGEPVKNGRGQTFDWLMAVCDRYVAMGARWVFGSVSASEVDQTDVTDMWKAYEVLTGHPAATMVASYGTDRTYPVSPFRCAC